MNINQNPEQIARNEIDRKLNNSGWIVQEKSRIDWSASKGIAVKEYLTDVGPADYVLFVDKKSVGIIEAKRGEEGHRLTVIEGQSSEYASSKLKFLNNDPLPFVYESTGKLTRFTDQRDPRYRPVFSFLRPETFAEYVKKKPLREKLLNIPELRTDGLRDCQIKAILNLEKSFKDNHPRALIQMANEWLILLLVIIPSMFYIRTYIVYIVHKELSCKMKQIQDRVKPDPAMNFIDVQA